MLGLDTYFTHNGTLEFTWFDGGFCSSEAYTINQVKNLMSHLQRALDEHGDKQ